MFEHMEIDTTTYENKVEPSYKTKYISIDKNHAGLSSIMRGGAVYQVAFILLG